MDSVDICVYMKSAHVHILKVYARDLACVLARVLACVLARVLACVLACVCSCVCTRAQLKHGVILGCVFWGSVGAGLNDCTDAEKAEPKKSTVSGLLGAAAAVIG
jgi:hypothetical protein